MKHNNNTKTFMLKKLDPIIIDNSNYNDKLNRINKNNKQSPKNFNATNKINIKTTPTNKIKYSPVNSTSSRRSSVFFEESDIYDRKKLFKKIILVCLNPSLIACMLYVVASISMIITNKLILSVYKFEYPMVLLLHQNLCTIATLSIARKFGFIKYDDITYEKAKIWAPVDIFFVLMLLTSFYSVRKLSVPMVTIFKNTNSIFVAIGDYLLYGNVSSLGVIVTLFLMFGAAVLAGLNGKIFFIFIFLFIKII